MNGLLPLVLAGVGVVLVFVLAGLIYVKNRIKVSPNRVAVFSGRGKEPTIVTGGARMRIPGIEEVKFMELIPFNVHVDVRNVNAKGGVPVNVTATGLVRFGSTSEALRASVGRFLGVPASNLQNQVTGILTGIVRNIIPQMTVEELNSDREGFKTKVLDEATQQFGNIGMQVDNLTIQTIDDDNGFLASLGAAEIANKKRDAEVGRAQAASQSRIAQATADQLAAEAEAISAAAIAAANRDRDVAIAQTGAQVQAERARAAAEGERAAAAANQAVVTARAETESARVRAQIGVEELRAQEAQQRLVAEEIRPAEAAREAARLRAEGEKLAAVLKAEGEAEATRATGTANAEARKAAASAREAEMLAEAAGQKAQAEALAALTEEAARQRILPDLIKILPDVVAAAGASVAQINGISIIDGGTGGNGNGDNADSMTRVASLVPLVIAQSMQVFKTLTGVDLGASLTGNAQVITTTVPTTSPDGTQPDVVAAS